MPKKKKKKERKGEMEGGRGTPTSWNYTKSFIGE